MLLMWRYSSLIFVWFLGFCVTCEVLSGASNEGKLKFDLPDTQPSHETSSEAYLDITDVIFIVISQHNTYHIKRAEIFQEHFWSQIEENKLEKPVLFLTHEQWPNEGAWTIFPLIPDIAKSFTKKKWVFFCEDETRLKITPLLEALRDYDYNKDLFLGKVLWDQEATIIHHFAFFNNPASFLFPDFAAGFFLSMALVKNMARRLDSALPRDFSIDPKHELAMFIWNEGNGVALKKMPGLCTGPEKQSCFTWYPVDLPDCGKAVSESDLYVAVKTCEKFHTERVPVVQKTWGKETQFLTFYSEKEDPAIPTVSSGVPNTERGHCGKMMAILERAYSSPDMSQFSWLAITDDDTIMSLKRLRKLLACYDPEEAVALGERYGYGVPAGYGYEYITGGGGMILSRRALEIIIESRECECGSDDSPDDMMLGICLKRLGIPVTHSPNFHQARPDDYATEFLKRQKPISFHKHWNVDPYKVYRTWFSEQYQHDEL